MALIEPFMVKTGLNLTADEVLEVEAKTGESLLIKDVIIYRPNTDYVVLEIDKTTVGFFRVTTSYLGSHLFPVFALANNSRNYVGLKAEPSITLISYMIRKGWMRGYPVAEGQKFRVKPYTSGKYLGDVVIVYEKYDAGDIKSTDLNGSEASEYIFVNYGQPSNALEEAGDYLINNCVTAKEFPDFPFGEAVPSKTTIEVLGILGSESLDYQASDTYTYTKFLKMFKGRKCLFDRDRQGLLFYHPIFSGITSGTYVAKGFSIVGNYSSVDRREPFLPPTPLVFNSGDEVNVYVTAGQATNAGSIDEKYVEIAFIERVKIVE